MNKAWFRVIFALVLLASIPFFAGCPLDASSAKKDDLYLADKAFDERDIGDAEMYFERYLRKNPEGEDRWDVWLQLLAISLDIRQDKSTAAEYLEIMLREYTDDTSKRRLIQKHLADLYKDIHAYPRATVLWEALASDPDLISEERAVVYRELSHAYLRRLEFTAAIDVLDLCLQLDVRPDTKVDCFYALAETQMLTYKLAESEKALRELLSIEGASPDRRVLATFFLADVLEQREKWKEAMELFESIRETYPNAKVIEVRLGALKNKLSGKGTKK